MHLICIFALAIGYTLFSTPVVEASPTVSKTSCSKSNLNKIKNKFGLENMQNINKLVEIKLKRKILE